MRVLGLLILSTLTTSSWAEESCSAMTSFGEVENLIQVNCELEDQKRSCAKTPVDPDAIKKSITSLFDSAITDQAKIVQQWDNGYKARPVSQLFNADNRKNNNQKPPEFILEWFKRNNPDIDQEALKAKIIDSYVQFGKQYDCLPKIHTRDVSRVFPGPKYKTEQESRNAVRDLSQFQDFINKGRGEMAIDGLVSCSDKPNPGHGPWKTVSYLYPPCSGNITQNFANNAWTISPSEAQSIASSNGELSRCIQESIKNGAKIHHVSVIASASALNNTGAAKERFCAKGFRELSEARAQSAISSVLPLLLPDPSLYAPDKVEVKSEGSNGDGTSGDCPYKLVNGKEVLKPEYAPGGSRRAELDKARYVTIVVTFDEKINPASNGPGHYQPSLNCQEISFRCR